MWGTMLAALAWTEEHPELSQAESNDTVQYEQAIRCNKTRRAGVGQK